MVEFTAPMAELFLDGSSSLRNQVAYLADLAGEILAGTGGSLARAREAGHLPGNGQLTLHVVRLRDAGDDAANASEGGPAHRL